MKGCQEAIREYKESYAEHLGKIYPVFAESSRFFR